jgi:plastocyanin
MSICKNGLCLSALAVLGSLALTSAILSGCGGAQGVTSGASSPTSITIKHGKEKGEATAAATKGGAEGGGVAPAAASGGFGTLKGRVVFEGTPKPLESLTAQAETKEPVCAKAGIPNDKLIIGDGNGVANVFIFLPKAPPGVAVPPVPSEPVKFDQKSCRFFPHALVIRAGQDLKILNSDTVSHNTHTYAQRSDTNFNKIIPPHSETGEDFKYQLSESKPVEVKCDIHTWMRAYHLPLDHPWAAITGPNGEYVIKDVPAGTYKFQVWHEAAGGGGYLDRNMVVTIKPGEVTTKDIQYDASKLEL